MNEYEGLESLERVPFNPLIACAGLLDEWSQFKDAMFDTSNSSGMPYIMSAERAKRVVLQDKLRCADARASYKNILTLMAIDQATPFGAMEVERIFSELMLVVLLAIVPQRVMDKACSCFWSG